MVEAEAVHGAVVEVVVMVASPLEVVDIAVVTEAVFVAVDSCLTRYFWFSKL